MTTAVGEGVRSQTSILGGAVARSHECTGTAMCDRGAMVDVVGRGATGDLRVGPKERCRSSRDRGWMRTGQV